MRISSASGDFVELRLDGYEFGMSSKGVANDWDANWLYVRGHARWLGEKWSFRDPCLTTWEAREFLGLLRSASLFHQGPRTLEFTEPNLAFTLDQDTRGGSTLVVMLSYEAAPPSLSLDERSYEGIPLSFQLSRAALAAAADDWERELATHPPR